MSMIETTAANATDGELLMRFVKHRDEEAFGLLVQRHANLVWGICSRQLRYREDSEDAFQATFVRLAQKAQTIRNASSVASWLYKVAYRAAIHAGKARCRIEEQPLETEPEIMDNVFAELHCREQAMILDEEVSRLPDRLRNVIALCCIEGKSRSEVALELDCTDATVKSRLARGRRILRLRLARRGIGLAVVLGTILSNADNASAAPPVALVESAVQAGLAAAQSPPTSWTSSWRGIGLTTLLGHPLMLVSILSVIGIAFFGQVSVPAPAETSAVQVEEVIAIEDPIELELVMAFARSDPPEFLDDAELNYLRVQAEVYDKQAAAKRLQVDAWNANEKKNDLLAQARRLNAEANVQLVAATKALPRYQEMVKQWGREETVRVMNDPKVELHSRATNRPAIIAAMTEKARRFHLPDEPDVIDTMVQRSKHKSPADSSP